MVKKYSVLIPGKDGGWFVEVYSNHSHTLPGIRMLRGVKHRMIVPCQGVITGFISISGCGLCGLITRTLHLSRLCTPRKGMIVTIFACGK